MKIDIDFSKRSDFIFQHFGEINSQRIVAIALPFLSLNPTTSTLASIGVGGYQGYVVLKDIFDINSPTKENQWLHLILVTSSTALGIIFPTGQLVLSTAVFLCVHLEELYGHIQNGEWKESGMVCLQLAHQLIHTGSQYYRTPLWLATSLILQASTEFYQAVQCWQAGNQELEIIASLSLAIFRLHRTYYLSPLFKKRDVVLIVTSPWDYNGALGGTKNYLSNNKLMNAYYKVIQVSPQNLNDLQRTFKDLHAKGRNITHIMFSCHGIPIAIKPTNFLIKMPVDQSFADNYFKNYSEMRRVPASHEYEAFDRFVEIIRKGISKNGKVILLSCSTAKPVDHLEKNFANALARRLPGIEVTGSTKKFISLYLNVSIGPTSINIETNNFKKFFY